jgi:hypothetical protein
MYCPTWFIEGAVSGLVFAAAVSSAISLIPLKNRERG